MNPSLLDKLCCPIDKSDLELKHSLKNQEGEIIEGLLTCAKCKRYYPVIYGIPIMTPDEYREKSLEAPVLERLQIDKSGENGKFYLE